MTRRLRPRRSFRKPTPGHSFWIRPPALTVSLRAASVGVYSDILLTEADFADPSANLNDTQKGAPVLERLVTDVGFDQVVTEAYFDPAAFGQVTMLVEAMIYTQEDQFAAEVVNSSTFDTTLANNRVLGYSVMHWNMDTQIFFGAAAVNPRSSIRCKAHIEPKSRVKLREKSVCVAIRTNMDVGNAAVLATFPWVQPTMLVRVP